MSRTLSIRTSPESRFANQQHILPEPSAARQLPTTSRELASGAPCRAQRSPTSCRPRHDV